MRRVDWRTNDGAVTLVLLGVLAAVAGATLYGSPVYLDEAEACASLAAAATDPSTIAASCVARRAPRADSVRLLLVVAAVLVVAGTLTSRRRWVHAHEDRPAVWTLSWWAVLPAAWTGLWLATSYDNLVVVGPAAVASGVLGAWWCASLLRDTATRAHLLAASAVAVPVVCAGVAATQVARWRTPSRPWRVQEASFPVDGWPVLLAFAVTAVLFAAAVGLARWRRPAPNLWIGTALFVVSTAAVVPVFVQELVPAWQGDVATRPGPPVWMPTLLAPALLAVLVWCVCAVRRRDPVPAAS